MDSKSEVKDIELISSKNDDNPKPSTATIVTQFSQVTNSNEIEKLYDLDIKSKHTKIIKHKKMTPTNRKLQKIHANLWEPHNPSSLSRKTYVGSLLNEFTSKSLVLLLWSKVEFFDTFKLWLKQAKEANREKLRCFQTDGGGEFISSALKSFCKKNGINIGYIAPYVHKENGTAQ